VDLLTSRQTAMNSRNKRSDDFGCLGLPTVASAKVDGPPMHTFLHTVPSGPRYPLQVLARSSLWAFRYYRWPMLVHSFLFSFLGFVIWIGCENVSLMIYYIWKISVAQLRIYSCWGQCNKSTTMINEIVLKAIVTEFTRTIGTRTSGFLGDLVDETRQFLDDGLAPYLEKQKTKYSHTKTLLHRTTPIYFYDIYFPLKVICDKKEISTDSINNVFIPSQFVTIVGDAGSGKSTLVKHLFLNAIAEKFCIPILVELRYLNEFNDSLEVFLKEKIFENKLSKNHKILEKLLENGEFVFFLDGFDELKSDSKERVVKNINSFIDRYRSNRFLLTSRPYSNIELLPMFHNSRIKNLELTEIKEFVLMQKVEQQIAEKLTKSVTESKNIYINEYLTNPLLLSLYILTFSTNSSIPNKKYVFYRRVLDVLFKEHDSLSKFGYDREVLTKLNQDEFENILQAFSFITYLEAEFDFEKDYLNKTLTKIKDRLGLKFSNSDFIEDLKSSIALWTEDSGIVAFAHRSMQEYFAALYIKNVNQSKKQIYQKVHEKLFAGKRRHNETLNFLGLIDEMDKYSYRKYLYLPALKKVKSLIQFQSVDSKIQSVLKLLFSDLRIGIEKTEDGMMLGQNPAHRKCVFTIENYQTQIVGEIFSFAGTVKVRELIIKQASIGKPAEKNMAGISFDKPLSLELLREFRKSSVKSSVLETIAFLKREITETEKFIKLSASSEESLLDLV